MLMLRLGRGRFLRFKCSTAVLMVSGVLGFGFARVVCAEGHADYRLVERFFLPAGAGPLAALPDGRLITLIGADVHIEAVAGSRSFAFLGTLPTADVASFGAAFLRVSPDGTRIAVGNNGGASFVDFEVGVFAVPTLIGDWFTAPHFDAAWIDDTHLALTTGEFGFPSRVTLLDTASPDPTDPDNPTVIDNIGGASGGVAIDELGHLYTSNGFTLAGPSGTGLIKAFAASDWLAAAVGTPLDFETDGVEVVDVLSGSPLVFDAMGNLVVGGGDFSTAGQFDFVAVVDVAAIAGALAGGGVINGSDSAAVRRLDPDAANTGNFFGVTVGIPSDTLYVRDAGDLRVHVFSDLMGVPAVTTWGLVVFALTAAVGATLALRGSGAPGLMRESCR